MSTETKKVSEKEGEAGEGKKSRIGGKKMDFLNGRIGLRIRGKRQGEYRNL